MIYVVSGYRRSGTSMMMNALYAGLREGQILYQPGQERIGTVEKDGYTPNPSPLREVGQAYYMNPAFLRQIPDESLLKILFDGLPHLPRRAWTVFFMHRDEGEITASCNRVDQHLRQVGVKENAKNHYPFDCFRPFRQEEMMHVTDICEARVDVNLVHVQYREVIENPLEAFRVLSNHIPIDPEKSAAIVNPELYRFRNGSTSEGRDAGPPPVSEDIESAGQEDYRQSRAV